MLPTSSDNIALRSPAIFFSAIQSSSSRLTLVLWPASTIESLTTSDFMVARFENKVSLEGRVGSRDEREAVEIASWSAAGVQSVDDRLTIVR